jgi:hypothetical protein
MPGPYSIITSITTMAPLISKTTPHKAFRTLFSYLPGWLVAFSVTALSITCVRAVEEPPSVLADARRSAIIASHTLGKVQRWLHEAALPKIDPKTGLYLSHDKGSGRYPKALWNYDDTAADTYPFLFWAAWYTDHDKIDGPILGVLEAEQRLCNHLDRIPTAYDPATQTKDIKTKDDLIFAASEYVKDGLIAIVEVAGTNNPWFERMRAIEDDIWKHADIETPYGMIPTNNLEANGEQIQALVRLFTATGERKYLDWAERLADYYLLKGDFVPGRLRDHGCEIIGGLGLLVAVQSVHHPEKAKVHLPLVRRMLDEVLKRGTNEDGFMHDAIDGDGRLSDGWGYNYVSYLCLDMATGTDLYRAVVEKPLRNLSNPRYHNINWGETTMDGIADSTEGAMYLINRLPVAGAIEWIDREVTTHITHAAEPVETGRLWKTYKLEANGVRTALQHAMMHTRGTIARPWRRDLILGASETGGGLTVVMKAEKPWEGRLLIDRPRHRMEMKFSQDWPRMNSMPEWFTAEPDAIYTVKNLTSGEVVTLEGSELHAGVSVTLEAGVEKQLLIRRQP